MDISQYAELEKRLYYVGSMKPLLNKRALFSDTTSDYVTPSEPAKGEKVTIRFRTAKNNVDTVVLISKTGLFTMEKRESDLHFDYYAVDVTMGDDIFEYYFEVKVGTVKCFYNARGITKELQDYYHFRIIPGFSTPEWAKGAVIYQIYTDRFCNGDPSNDVLTREYYYLNDYSQKVDDWYKYPAQMGVREFYGGDLQGVLDKMDYLSDLGIDVIYFNPLFVSPSNHKYDIQDYDYIDPHLGKIVYDEGNLLEDWQKENRSGSRYVNRVTDKRNLEASNKLFAKVVEEAHRRGMKVIMDGVFNHCGSFNKWLDRERIYEDREGYEKGAFVDGGSPYRNYFSFYSENWPYNESYDGWWGHNTLPKLNYEGSEELYNYILRIGQKWVSAPYNADGWRLDVAADLGHSPEFNHKFWKDFRKAVKEANPNALILAEHYGTPREWLKGDEWDTVMNYDAFMEPVTWFLTGMQKHSDDYREDLLGNADSFWGAMGHHGTNFTTPSLQVSMNELSNHDHSRFLTRTNHKVGRMNTLGCHAAEENINKSVMRSAVMIQMTWVGAPTIYYGDEAGLCGFTDPDNRRTYPWGREDNELISFHREMIRLHKERKEMLTGSLMKLGADYNFIAYARVKGSSVSIVMINNNFYEIEKKISIWETGADDSTEFIRRIFSYTDGFTMENLSIHSENGYITLRLPANGSVVLCSVEAEEDTSKSREKQDVHEIEIPGEDVLPKEEFDSVEAKVSKEKASGKGKSSEDNKEKSEESGIIHGADRFNTYIGYSESHENYDKKSGKESRGEDDDEIKPLKKLKRMEAEPKTDNSEKNRIIKSGSKDEEVHIGIKIADRGKADESKETEKEVSDESKNSGKADSRDEKDASKFSAENTEPKSGEENGEESQPLSAWEVAERIYGKPTDPKDKKKKFPFFK